MSASLSSLNIALVGNPNCGKTALFNRLTGARQKVGNYAGVTVERKLGACVLPSGRRVEVLDLPGAYSLAATSPDEAITRDVCQGKLPGQPRPELLVCVVDATNLRLHLRFVLELRELGLPMLLVLNMMDSATRRGMVIDTQKLSAALDMPVVQTVAVRQSGIVPLLQALDGELPPVPRPLAAGVDAHMTVRDVLASAVSMPTRTSARDDAIDRVMLHPVWGLFILAAVMLLLFQAVFSWAAPFQDAIDSSVQWLSAQVQGSMPAGPLRDFIVEAALAGMGSVLVFLPQILLLFFFIIVLEESGYLPRAAFLLDKLMVGAGLSGRSFIPLLSSFACAVPGIMATRSIQDPRDRLVTILVAPFMTCSARLPVYALLIGAFIPSKTVLGVFNLQGLVLFGLYLFGIVSALAVAYVIKYFTRARLGHFLLLELPSYRLPSPRNVVQELAQRGWIFIHRVGTIIFAVSVLLWFLATYPAAPEGWTDPAIYYSYAGRLGHLLEVVFSPLGFNWAICIALIPGFFAREVAVAGLATVYAVGANAGEVSEQALGAFLSAHWSLPTALSLMVWYVFAPQCVSTIVTMRRETGSWKITAGAAFGMLMLAYLASLLTYQTALMWSL